MALALAFQQKKQKYLIGLFLAVILITAVVAWFGFFREEKAPTSQIVVSAPPPIIINFDLLQNNQFLKEAQPFEEIPPLPPGGRVGRQNPFSSF